MSFFAYQSFLGVKASELMALLPPDRPEPTITMVLNIPIPAAKDRCARRTGLDLVPESLSSDERQTHAAEYYAGQAGDRVVHLDALQSRAIVAEQAWQAYEALTGR
jgi:thymidylate kinase